MSNDLVQEQMENMGSLKEKVPGMMEGFHQFMGAVEKDGALDAKTKELIALSLGIKAQCPSCIAIHVKKALGLGVTKEQMIEAGMVAVLMGGGPSLMYMKELQNAIEKYS